jgi:hypothetical protein
MAVAVNKEAIGCRMRTDPDSAGLSRQILTLGLLVGVVEGTGVAALTLRNGGFTAWGDLQPCSTR